MNMSTATLRTSLLCAVLLTLVVALGASAQGLTRVTVQIDGAAVPYYLPLYIAKEKGFFAEEGLDVEFLYGAAADIVRNVAVQNVEFGFPNADSVIAARASGIPVKVVHTTLQHGLGATIFKTNRGIKEPRDLKGKTVAITSYGSPNYIQLQVLLKNAGLTLDDINLRIVGTGAIVNALVTDQVDAIVFSMLRTFELRHAGVDVSEWRSDDFLPSFGNVVVTSDAYAERNPQVVRAFIRGLNKALQYLIDGNVRTALDVVIPKYTPSYEGNEDYLTDVLNQVYVGYLWQSEDTAAHGLGWGNLDRWNEAIRIQREYGIINRDLDAAEFVTNEFLN